MSGCSLDLRLGGFRRQTPNPFLVADTIFGVMLLILASLSVIWHASNAPKSQYIDLWSMDSCIAYLIIRCACQGVLVLLIAHVDDGSACSYDITTVSTY